MKHKPGGSASAYTQNVRQVTNYRAGYSNAANGIVLPAGGATLTSQATPQTLTIADYVTAIVAAGDKVNLGLVDTNALVALAIAAAPIQIAGMPSSVTAGVYFAYLDDLAAQIAAGGAAGIASLGATAAYVADAVLLAQYIAQSKPFLQQVLSLPQPTRATASTALAIANAYANIVLMYSDAYRVVFQDFLHNQRISSYGFGGGDYWHSLLNSYEMGVQTNVAFASVFRLTPVVDSASYGYNQANHGPLPAHNRDMVILANGFADNSFGGTSSYAYGIALDSSNRVYYGDRRVVRRIDQTTGNITVVPTASSFSNSLTIRTISGVERIFYIVMTVGGVGADGIWSCALDGSDAIQYTGSQCYSLQDIKFDSAGNMYALDSYHNCVWKWAAGFAYNTPPTKWAGYLYDAMFRPETVPFGGVYTGSAGTTALTTNLSWPHAMAFDSQDNLYVSCAYSRDYTTRPASLLDKISPDEGVYVRVIKITQAGNTSVYAGDGTFSGCNGLGKIATQMTFQIIDGLVFDRYDNLYMSDFYNERVLRVDAVSKIVTQVAGYPISTCLPLPGNGYANVDPYYSVTPFAPSGRLFRPKRLAIDSSGNLYTPNAFVWNICKIPVAGSNFALSPT